MKEKGMKQLCTIFALLTVTFFVTLPLYAGNQTMQGDFLLVRKAAAPPVAVRMFCTGGQIKPIPGKIHHYLVPYYLKLYVIAGLSLII
jgi:hypothetical protein